MKYSFNLIDEPWIPVQTTRANDPPIVMMSLTDVFNNCRDIRRIENGRPLVVAALHRLLIAIVVRAIPPLEYAAIHRERLRSYIEGDMPTSQIIAYLEKYRHRFDLFDTKAPFMQVAGIEESAWKDPWYRLTAEDGSGNTSAISNPQKRLGAEGEPRPLAAAEAACLLVAHQQYALGGLIQRVITSIQSAKNAPSAAFVLEGVSLAHTLMLNTPHVTPMLHAVDVAWWERRPVTRADVDSQVVSSYVGFVSAWTWPSRAILFVPIDGERWPVLQYMYYAPGVPMAEVDTTTGRDPMSAYRTTKDGIVMPLRISVDKAMWRNCHAFLPTGVQGMTAPNVVGQAYEMEVEIGNANPLTTWTIRVLGQANDKSKIDFVLDESYAIGIGIRGAHGGLAAKALEDVNSVASALGSGLFVFANEVLSTNEKKGDPDAAKKLAESTRTLERYWWLMNSEFTGFLAGPGSEHDYEELIKRVLTIARRLLHQTVESQGLNRRVLRGVAPAIRAFENAIKKLGMITTNSEVQV